MHPTAFGGLRQPEKLKEEFQALLPPAIFFFVALHLVALVRVLMLQGTGISVSTSASVTLAALIIAKAVLVADLLPFINRYPLKPLVYNVTWKTAIYFLVATFVHYLERLVDYWREAGGLVAGNEKLLSEIRVIGGDKVREIFFGSPQSGTVSG